MLGAVPVIVKILLLLVVLVVAEVDSLHLEVAWEAVGIFLQYHHLKEIMAEIPHILDLLHLLVVVEEEVVWVLLVQTVQLLQQQVELEAQERHQQFLDHQ